jgi:hypothetical protein
MRVMLRFCCYSLLIVLGVTLPSSAQAPATKSPATPGTQRAGSVSSSPAVPKSAPQPVTAPPAVTPKTTVESAAPKNETVQPAAPKAGKLDKYELKYRFQVGEVLRTRTSQQSRVETMIGGSTQVAEMSSISEKSWQVKKVDEQGNVTFETRWDAIEMKQKMTGREEVRYNSRTDKTAPAGYEQIASVIGIPLSLVTIDPRGKLLKREAANDKTRNLHEQSTYQANQQLFLPLPAEAVTLAQPWSTPTEIKISLSKDAQRTVQARQRYSIDTVANNIATIVHETILPPLNDPEIRAQAIQQMGKGTIKFDLKSGRILQQISQVDERVIGFHGQDSSIHFESKFTEEILPANATVQKNVPATPTKK